MMSGIYTNIFLEEVCISYLNFEDNQGKNFIAAETRITELPPTN